MDVAARVQPEVLRADLERLGVDPQDRAVLLDWAPRLDASDLARIAELAAQLLDCCPRRLDGAEVDVFGAEDAHHRLGAGVLPLFALVLASSGLAEVQLSRGLPEDVVRATQADLGLQLRKHRAVHGRTGLTTASWLAVVFSSGFARLGRLQYELVRRHPGAGDGEPVWTMAVHVPGDGPMEPEAVDESLLQAATFFEDRFPELGPIDWYTCTSWLLDPALRFLLPGSNIAAFGARWDVWRVEPDDRGALYFGFDVEPAPGAAVADVLDQLPTDTGLHRALVAHWRSGEHVMVCAGRLPVIRQLEEPGPTVGA